MKLPVTGWEAVITLLGMAAITVVTRSFFLFSDREPALPDWVHRGLRYAPVAAIAAVLAPEILMREGRLIDDWRDARLFAAAAAAAYYFWRRGILGTMVVGMAVLVPLKLGLGW